MAEDETLRDFVAAEIVRAGIALATAQDNSAHWHRVALALDEKLAACRKRRGGE